jgi:hypothetical protein
MTVHNEQSRPHDENECNNELKRLVELTTHEGSVGRRPSISEFVRTSGQYTSRRHVAVESVGRLIARLRDY